MNKAKIIIISAVLLFMAAVVVVNEATSEQSGISGTFPPETSEPQTTAIGESEYESEYTFHRLPSIEQLILDYNAIAEVPVTVDMLHDSSIRNTLYVSCNGVWITIFESFDELWVKFQIDADTDIAYYPIYRDFLAALGAVFANDDFLALWEEQIITLGVMDDLTIDGLLCTYNDMAIDGGKFRYTGSIRKSLK